MEACNLLLSFRDLSFLLFYAESLFTTPEVLLLVSFFFPSRADLFILIFFLLQSLLLSCGVLSSSLLPPSFILVIPVVFIFLFVLPFLLLFIHPHLCFSFPVLHAALFLSILSHSAFPYSAPRSLFSHCESCSIRFLT